MILTMHGFVYGLIDPRTDRIRYIGQTTKPKVADRIASHVAPSQLRTHSHLGRWMRGLIASGHRPIGVPLIAARSQSELDALEIAFINHMRSTGESLVNMSAGGGGRAGYVPSDEEREKISAAQRGIPRSKHTPEWRVNMSAKMKGRVSPNSEEHHRKLADSKRGVPRSVETRAKIAAAKLGEQVSQRHIDAILAKDAREYVPQAERVGVKHSRYRHDISNADIVKMLDDGMAKTAIAKRLGVAPTFVHRRIKQMRGSES